MSTTRIPTPDSTPDGPTYEGRLLDRPDEEVVDQGAAFDLGTLFSRRPVTRRAVFGLFGVGAGAALLAACAPAATGQSQNTGTSAGEIPDETAGPYPGDGSNGPDVLDESGIVRNDIRTSIGGEATVAGIPLIFRLKVLDMAGGDVPFENVAVYAWHCDAEGRYSMYSEGALDETFLRGVQVADAKGEVEFISVVPGCYSGRWPHIHFEVYPDVDAITDATNAIATSQLAFPEDMLPGVYADSAYPGSTQNLAGVTLESDGIFGDDGGASQLATVTGDISGYTATLTVRVDTRTEPTGGGMAPGGEGGMPGGGPGGPGDGGQPPAGGPGGPGGAPPTDAP